MKKLLLLFIAAPMLAQQAGPQREAATVNSIKIQMADCNINLGIEYKYTAQLEAQIKDLQRQLAEAKAGSK